MACSENAVYRPATSVLSLTFEPCFHRKESKSVIAPFNNSTTFIDIFSQYHDFNLKNNECKVVAGNGNGKSCGNGNGKSCDITQSLTVGEVTLLFGLRHFTFSCQCAPPEPMEVLVSSIKNAENADKQTVNAFQLMMAGGGRSFPSKKTSR